MLAPIAIIISVLMASSAPTAVSLGSQLADTDDAYPAITPVAADSIIMLNHPISAPDFTIGDWQAAARTVDAANHVSYSNTPDGAVMAFGDFFKAMAYDFSTTYTSKETGVESEAAKNKLIDQQLPLTMQYLDRSVLGTEKVNAVLHKWIISSRMLGTGGSEIAASHDEVVVNADGTVTLTDSSIFYKNTSGSTPKPLGSDGERYKLAYRNGIWRIVDVDIKNPAR